MRNTRNSKNNNSPASLEIFTTWSDDVLSGGRLDAKYWLPAIRELQKAIQNGKYKSQKLGDFITDIRYGLSTANDYVDFGIPFLRILNLKNDGIDINDVVYLSEDQKDEIGKAIVHEGDLLISRSGSVGIVVVVPKEAENFAFGSFMIKFCLNEKINKQFIAAWLNSEASRKLIEREKIGAIQGNITIETIKNFDIPIPPLSVQNEVVAKIQEAYEQKKKKETEILKILSSIDDFVLGELGVDMPRGGAERVFQIWSDEIQTRLDPSYFRPIFKMLDKIFSTTKYNVKTLKNLSTKITSGATPLSGGDAYTEQYSGIPFVRSGNINPDNKIDFNSLLYVKPEIHNKKLKSSQLKKGDLMIAIVGATIGQVSVYDNDREANINQAIALIRLGEQVNPEYAKEFLYSKIGQIQLDRIKRPVARANINLDEVGSLQVIYPPKDKQNEMVAKIRKIRAKATELRQEAETVIAEAQKQTAEMIFA
jgi:restriction endonuclease S subunit